MRKAWTVAVGVAGVLAMAAGAVAQEPGRTEEQVRERVEQQVGNAGEADHLRTQQETEQAIEQRAKQPEGAGGQGQKAQVPLAVSHFSSTIRSSMTCASA